MGNFHYLLNGTLSLGWNLVVEIGIHIRNLLLGTFRTEIPEFSRYFLVGTLSERFEIYMGNFHYLLDGTLSFGWNIVVEI